MGKPRRALSIILDRPLWVSKKECVYLERGCDLFKEQFKNMGIIFRISRYEDMANYQSHYLGLVWEYLYPLIQIGIYWIVFGVGLKHGQSNGVDYLPWMVIGITPWFYMNRATLDAPKVFINGLAWCQR